jgi:hypothetical protein
MSYSFNIRAATAALAIASVGEKFGEIAENQRAHLSDREPVVAVATAMIGLCVEPSEGEELSVTVSGWLQWRAGDGVVAPHEFTGASVSVQASVVAKPAAG